MQEFIEKRYTPDSCCVRNLNCLTMVVKWFDLSWGKNRYSSKPRISWNGKKFECSQPLKGLRVCEGVAFRKKLDWVSEHAKNNV